jgi:hypothetical protein
VFQKYPDLLSVIGRDGQLATVEEFVCRLYRAADPQAGVDYARWRMFQKGQLDLEKLPPTKDALGLHFFRANFLCKICLQSENTLMNVGQPPDSGGWRDGPDETEIVWLRQPAVPTACIELISCGCKTKCKTAACRCSKTGQICTTACACDSENCSNPNMLN